MSSWKRVGSAVEVSVLGGWVGGCGLGLSEGKHPREQVGLHADTLTEPGSVVEPIKQPREQVGRQLTGQTGIRGRIFWVTKIPETFTLSFD